MCSTGCVTPLACLPGALEALAGQDLKSSFGPAVLERSNALLRARNRLDAELARTVREGELTQAPEHDGKATMASWLGGHHRLSKAEANRLVRSGRALEQLPVLAAAAAAGAVPPEAVTAIAPIAAPDTLAAAEAQGVDVAEIDAALTRAAMTAPHADLRQAVGHYLARLDPDGTEPDPTEQRSLTITRHTDGSVSFHGTLDAVGGEKFQAAVESNVQADRPAGDTRTRTQQAGDALVQLADNALTSGNLPTLRGHKPQVIVTIPLADLVDTTTGAGAGRTGFGALISAAKARWLACDGNVTRIVIGPDSQPLDLGRNTRLFPPHLRRAVETRDRHCVFAGCDAPSYWCDVHHLVHWIDDGETNLDNSALLCERHSHLVSTTASALNDNPTADGAPGAPTAPRSSSTSPSSSEPDRSSAQPPGGPHHGARCAAYSAARYEGAVSESQRYESGLVVENRGHVRVLTLDRPERRNALSSEVQADLVEQLLDAGEGGTVRAIVLTGNGPAFCAGFDLKEIREKDDRGERFRPPMNRPGRSLFEVVTETPVPLVAALQGHAVAGGFELALACDLRVAAPGIKLGLPEATIGMGANFGSVVLPKRIPMGIALEMLLTGEYVTSEDAARWGLVNRIVDADAVLPTALELAERIAANAPISVRRMKETAVKGVDLPLWQALRLDVGPNPYLSEDRREGIAAYLEKRRPEWRGR